MKKLVLMAFALLVITRFGLGQTTSLSTGLWSDGSIWSTGAVPLTTATVQVNHSVFIDQNITVTTGTYYFGQTGGADEYITDVAGGSAYTLTATTAGGVIDVLDGITTFEGAGNIDDATLYVRAGATLILGGLTINNNSKIYVYGTLIINGNFTNLNNGTGTLDIFSNGLVQVNGNYTSSVGNVNISGGGDLYTTGTISTTGSSSIFNSTNDCGAGPCSGRNLCGFTNSVASNQVLCSGSTPASLTCTTNAGTPTYQWQYSTSAAGNYVNITAGGGFNTATLDISSATGYTLPTAAPTSGTRFYRCVVTSGGCIGYSNPVQVTYVGATAWIGHTSDWNTATNWCNNTVPTSATSVVLSSFPAGSGKFMPVVSTSANVRNLTINSGASITLSGSSSMNIFGDLTNNGTFTAGSSTVSFAATNRVQNLSGASYTQFYNLTVDNTFTTTPQLTANGNFAVNNNFTLSNGLVNLNTFTVTIGTSATSPGSVSRTNGWAYGGNIVKYTPSTSVAFGSGNDLLPIGSSSNYRPVQVAHTALAAGGYVRVAHSETFGSTLTAFTDTDLTPIQATSNSFWTISAGGFSGVTGTPFTLQTSGTGFGTVNSVNHLRLVGNSSALTGSSAGTNSGTTTNPVVQRTSVALTNISNNTLRWGTTNYALTDLPVTLIEFSAKPQSDHVLTKWSTATEINFSHFSLEHSVNGIDFVEVVTIPGKGNSSTGKEYIFKDYSPFIGKSYYRLTSIDNDGSKEVFDIVVVDYSGEKTARVFPNPVVGGKINIELTYTPTEPVTLILTDLNGVEIARQQIEDQSNTFTVDLNSGTYLVRIASTGLNKLLRVVVP